MWSSNPSVPFLSLPSAPFLSLSLQLLFSLPSAPFLSPFRFFSHRLLTAIMMMKDEGKVMKLGESVGLFAITITSTIVVFSCESIRISWFYIWVQLRIMHSMHSVISLHQPSFSCFSFFSISFHSMIIVWSKWSKVIHLKNVKKCFCPFMAQHAINRKSKERKERERRNWWTNYGNNSTTKVSIIICKSETDISFWCKNTRTKDWLTNQVMDLVIHSLTCFFLFSLSLPLFILTYCHYLLFGWFNYFVIKNWASLLS